MVCVDLVVSMVEPAVQQGQQFSLFDIQNLTSKDSLLQNKVFLFYEHLISSHSEAYKNSSKR